MPFRRALLRIMLWSLALGAGLGAAAILLGGGSAIWRVSWTMLSAAVAAALMMLTSRLSEQKSGRTAGLVGMLLIIAEFLLILVVIWDVVPGGFEESVGLTAVFLFLCSLPVVLFIRLYAEPMTRTAAIAGLVLAGATFMLLMIGAWAESRWQVRNQWLSSGWAVGGIGVLLAGCLVGLGRRPRAVVPVLFAGAGAAAFAMLVALIAIWEDLHEDSGLFRVLLSTAAVIAYANLAWMVPLTPQQVWVRLVTIAAAVCTAVAVNVSISLGSAPEAEFTGRLAGAAGVITGCGSLGLLVLARLNRRLGDHVPVLSEIQALTLICPGCNTRQALPVGEAACPTCRLKFRLAIEEPRCPQCDYLVFRLPSDRCPECGCALTRQVPPVPSPAEVSANAGQNR